MPVPTSISQLSQTPGNNSPQGSEIVGPYSNDYFQAAFAFIRQLYDNGGLPLTSPNANNKTIVNLANGVNNTDAATLGQVLTIMGAPSGTRVVFQQAAAPTYWTVDTNAAFTDCAVRFNQSVGNGGVTGWSAWNFGAQFNTAGHQLTVAEIASHNHGDAGHGHGASDGGHQHAMSDHTHAYAGYVAQNQFSYSGGGGLGGIGTPYTSGSNTGGMNGSPNVGVGYASISIGTGYANIQATGGNAAHSHTYTTPQVKYADCVICIKS